MSLVGAVFRNNAGKAIGDVLGFSGSDVILSGSVGEALTTFIGSFPILNHIIILTTINKAPLK